jgi:hypothetical protein
MRSAAMKENIAMRLKEMAVAMGAPIKFGALGVFQTEDS